VVATGVEPGGGEPSPAALRPHPITGTGFPSPVPPGSGWPGDRATPLTPVAGAADEAAYLAAGCADLAALDARSSVCAACPRLVAWREEVAARRRRSFDTEPYWGRPIPGWGDERPWLLVVGLAPAAHGGNRTGRIFTGDRSGDWLFAALHRAGFARIAESWAAGDGQRLDGARMVPAVRCAPPGNRPDPAERDACSAWLDREVDLVSPGLRVVLALGGFAWDATLGCARRLGWSVPSPRPRFGHGAEAALTLPGPGQQPEPGQQGPEGRDGRGPAAKAPGSGGRQLTLLGSYHVSQQNTFTGRLTEAMLDTVLARARALAGR